MKFWKFIYLTLIIIVPLFFILRTAFPSIPLLNGKVRVCDQNIFGWRILTVSSDKIEFFCPTEILLDTLYKAKTLNIVFKTDQQFDVAVQFTNGKEIMLSSNELNDHKLTFKPDLEKKEGIFILDLDNTIIQKINKLIKNMDGIIITITNFDKTKKIDLKIGDLYFQ